MFRRKLSWKYRTRENKVLRLRKSNYKLPALKNEELILK